MQATDLQTALYLGCVCVGREVEGEEGLFFKPRVRKFAHLQFKTSFYLMKYSGMNKDLKERYFVSSSFVSLVAPETVPNCDKRYYQTDLVYWTDHILGRKVRQVFGLYNPATKSP